MRLRWIWTTVALVAAGCGERTEDAPLPQSNGPSAATTAADARPRVLIVGTSLTAGMGLESPDESYPAVLQRMADSAGFGVRVVNAGVSGETSAGALRRLDWILAEPAAVVVVETGANDGLRGLNVDSTASTVRSIVKRIRERAPSAKIAIIQMEAPPNLGADYTRRFHALYGDVARETGVTLIPFLLEGVAGVAALNQADGIHPTAQGAIRMARNVWGSLAPLLPRPLR
jgi:acyl-CoA thioesterase-1